MIIHLESDHPREATCGAVGPQVVWSLAAVTCAACRATSAYKGRALDPGEEALIAVARRSAQEIPGGHAKRRRILNAVLSTPTAETLLGLRAAGLHEAEPDVVAGVAALDLAEAISEAEWIIDRSRQSALPTTIPTAQEAPHGRP